MRLYRLFLSFVPVSLCALPQGEEVSAGSAVFFKEGTTLHVTASDNTIIEYDTFNIECGEKVHFVQPKNSSTLLNRVKGDVPSAIFGQLTATGKIFLINPNGIIFGETACVDTHSLIASTMEILNTDFLQGNFQFFLKPGSESSKICNQGVLKAQFGGSIALLAPHISNEGYIFADTGTVLLASDEKVVIDFSGDGLIHFALEGALKESCIKGTLPLDIGVIQKVLEGIVNTDGIIAGSKMIEDAGMIRLVSSSHVEAAEVTLRGSYVEVEGSVISKGSLDIEASSILCLRDFENVPLIMHAGNNFILKGDLIDIYALNSPLTSLASGSNMIFISRNPISADGHFFAGGRFLLRDFEGKPASFLSIQDPYIVSSTDSGGVGVEFNSYSGSSLKVVAQGSINCMGTISITVADGSACSGGCSDPDCSILTSRKALILTAGTVPLANCGTATPTTQEGVFFDPYNSGSSIFLAGNISNCDYVALTGDVVLQTNLTIGILSGGTFISSGSINSDSSSSLRDFILQATGADVTMTGDIGIATELNNLTVTADTITLSGNFSAENALHFSATTGITITGSAVAMTANTILFDMPIIGDMMGPQTALTMSTQSSTLIQEDIDILGPLTLTSRIQVVIDTAQVSADGGISVQSVNDNITIGGTAGAVTFTSQNNPITFSSPIVLSSGPVTMMSNGGDISLSTVGSITGPESFSVDAGSGNATFGGTINIASLDVAAGNAFIAGTMTFTSGLTVNSTIANFLSGTITAVDSIFFSAPQNIVNGQNTSYTSTGMNITFNGPINDSSSGIDNLSLQAPVGTIALNDAVGLSARLKSLSVNAATVNLPADFYSAATMTLSGQINLIAGTLTTLLSQLGGITIGASSVLQLSSGTDLVVSTNGGPFNFPEILGASQESVSIFSGSGAVSLGQMGSGGNFLGTVQALSGSIVFNGPIFANSVTFLSQTAIVNGSMGAQTITTTGNALFNAINGTVGTSLSPIDVQVGGIVTAGAPSLLADFNGMTIDNTIHINPLNPPCPVIFNAVTIRACPVPPPPPGPTPPSPLSLVPARDFYVPGIYSIYNNLGSDLYFLPEVVTPAYIALRSNLLYLAEKRYEKEKVNRIKITKKGI